MSITKAKRNAGKSQGRKSQFRFSDYVSIIGLTMLVIATVWGYSVRSVEKNDMPSSLTVGSILPPEGPILKGILIPRVPGSTGHAKVRNFIKSQFVNDPHWSVEEDIFLVESTPIGPTQFSNIIITSTFHSQQLGRKRIILAAHYDSKFLEMEKGEVQADPEKSTFIGATDSGWSCALLIYLAKSLKAEKLSASPFDVQLVFFDGEEAFKNWSHDDSLFGSRHLAAKWEAESGRNSLANIEMLILFDLLGGKELTQGVSHLFSQQAKTRNHFQSLMRIEQRRFPDLQKMFQLKFPTGPDSHVFLENAVEDDHTPFAKLNVPIMHLIPLPFPTFWHTEEDNVTALDRETCARLTDIIQEFVESLI